MKNLIEAINTQGETVMTAILGPRNIINMAKVAKRAGNSLRIGGFDVRPADLYDMANFHSEFDQDDPKKSLHYGRMVRDRTIVDLKDTDRETLVRRTFTIKWTASELLYRPMFQVVTEGLEIRNDFYNSCDRVGIHAENHYLNGYSNPPTELMRLGVNFSHKMTWPGVFADLAERGWDIEHTGDVPQELLPASRAAA